MACCPSTTASCLVASSDNSLNRPGQHRHGGDVVLVEVEAALRGIHVFSADVRSPLSADTMEMTHPMELGVDVFAMPAKLRGARGAVGPMSDLAASPKPCPSSF